MRKHRTGVLVCLIVLLAVAAFAPSAAAQCTAQSSWFSNPSIPSDVNLSTGNVDCAFQQFSWQSFIALAQSNTFMSYMPSQGVFVASGSQPLKWGQQPQIPASCGSGATMLLTQIDKTDPDSAILEAQDVQPLVDLNGNWVHYGIQMNQTAYNYLVNCSLWQAACYNNAGANIAFPWTATNPQGNSVVIKTAWKVLAGSDNPANFITAKAAVSPAGPTNPNCATVTVGLVGMHITQRTPTQAEWIWATFEHVNNDPPCTSLSTPPPLGGSWSFYKSNCSGSYCTTNTYFNPCSGNTSLCPTTSGPNQFCAACTQAGIPTQVCAVNPTGADTSGNIQALNTSVQGLAPAGSLLKNYKLVGTEWTADGTATGTISGSTLLANSVAETYVQTSDSCFSCHRSTFKPYPPSSPTSTSSADFSHLFDALDPSTANSCNPITPPSGYACPSVTGTASTNKHLLKIPQQAPGSKK
ncbi:MAG TPA: hypothetical protein VF179_01915 [Thermoanaerobaculia bacterium]|nr:hypothetical protein [Thermoanaerobaculia bacterium]